VTVTYIGIFVTSPSFKFRQNRLNGFRDVGVRNLSFPIPKASGLCRVARTHSRYWKLIKFHPSSVSAISVISMFSTINFNPNPTLQIIKSIINSPKLLANTQHTVVYSSCPTFHIVFHLPFLTGTSNRVETFVTYNGGLDRLVAMTSILF